MAGDARHRSGGMIFAVLSLLLALPGCLPHRETAAMTSPPPQPPPPPPPEAVPPPPPPVPTDEGPGGALPVIIGGGGWSSGGVRPPRTGLPGVRPRRGGSGSAAAVRPPAGARDGVSALPPAMALPASGGAPEFCPASGGIIAPGLCARITLLKAQLKPGSAAYNVPPAMVVGQVQTVRLSIYRQAGSAVPAADVGGLGGKTVTFAPVVGQFMRAELTASPATAFAIKANRETRQDLGAADGAIWEWSITALTAGHHHIVVRTWVELGADSAMPVSIANNPDQIVDVTVTGGQRASGFIDDVIAWAGKGTNLFKALALLVGAVGGLWLAIKKLRAG